jgi:HSP20 family molecular chaperone IbpA
MRYRRLSYRYTVITQQAPSWSLTTPWRGALLEAVFGRAHWQPDADVCESRHALHIIVDLAGMQEDDFEVQLFDDALVVEGRRELPACDEGAVYHRAGIRQGPFRLELPLPVAVDASAVDARYDRGWLTITLKKQEVAS